MASLLGMIDWDWCDHGEWGHWVDNGWWKIMDGMTFLPMFIVQV